MFEVDLRVGPGERIGVVGPSGSGKSTLARLLAGFLTPDVGRRHPTRRPGRPDPVQLVAQAPGETFDPRLTVRAALALVGGSGAGSALASRLRIPMEVLDRRPDALSGGQLQRAALLRALAVEPRFLILDEPTSALDRSHAARLLELVAEWMGRDRGVLVVSHELALIERWCDRVVVLDRGRVVESGPPGLVFSRPDADATRRLVAAARRLTIGSAREPEGVARSP